VSVNFFDFFPHEHVFLSNTKIHQTSIFNTWLDAKLLVISEKNISKAYKCTKGYLGTV